MYMLPYVSIYKLYVCMYCYIFPVNIHEIIALFKPVSLHLKEFLI